MGKCAVGLASVCRVEELPQIFQYRFLWIQYLSIASCAHHPGSSGSGLQGRDWQSSAGCTLGWRWKFTEGTGLAGQPYHRAKSNDHITESREVYLWMLTEFFSEISLDLHKPSHSPTHSLRD